MVATDRLAIVELGPDDVPGGLALSREAHWNQNEADWRFFLGAGTVFGIRDPDRRLIATAALLPYGFGNAWLSMVLVTAPWRRRGLATRLVDACLAAAASEQLTPWLDATPAGAAVYAPLGFTPTLQLRRLRLENSNRTEAGAPQLQAGNVDDFAARDRRAMGFDRSALLAEFCGRPNRTAWSSGNAIGLVRDGRSFPPHRSAIRGPAGSGAGPGRCDHPLRNRRGADRRRQHAGRISRRAHGARLAPSSGRFSACGSAAPRRMPRNRHWPSPDPNTDKDSRHAS